MARQYIHNHYNKVNGGVGQNLTRIYEGTLNDGTQSPNDPTGLVQTSDAVVVDTIDGSQKHVLKVTK